MFRDRTVSLVIPAYNEEETITQVVEEFRQQPDLDESLVVDNNCKDRTAERARAAGATVIEESKAGYGAALTAGMNAAKGDLLVLVEADGSFRAKDVVKLLCYLEDAGMVMGTRTTRQMVEQGANMRFLLRWGNVFMAKFLQLCWLRPSEPRFTDVGCTFRALTRETWNKVRERTREPGPAFSPEMMSSAASFSASNSPSPEHSLSLSLQTSLSNCSSNADASPSSLPPSASPTSSRVARKPSAHISARSLALSSKAQPPAMLKCCSTEKRYFSP